MIVLILGLAMIAPLPLEVIIGGYGRLALAVLGFLLIFWWLFKNGQKKDLSLRADKDLVGHRQGPRRLR